MSLSDVVAVVVSLAMWAIVVWILYGMGEDYWSLGRKEKTAIEQTRLENMRSPWLLVLSQHQLCSWEAKQCAFIPFRRDEVTGGPSTASYDCGRCVGGTTIDILGFPAEGLLLNSSCLHQMLDDDGQALSFQSQLDRVLLTFGVVDKTGAAMTETNISSCDPPGIPVSSTPMTIIPVTDEASVRKLQTKATKSDFNSPLRIALYHHADVLFRLSQEQFIDETVKDDMTVSMTQFKPPDPAYPSTTAVAIFPSSFAVQKVIHTQGETVWSLLGEMFGWIGVFTGACVQGLIMSTLAAYQSFKKKHDQGCREGDIETELVPKQCAESCRCVSLEEEVRELRDIVSQLTTLDASTSKRTAFSPPLMYRV